MAATTVTVLLIAGLMLLVGGLLLGGSRSAAVSCPRCGYRNRVVARFCGQCGAELPSRDKAP